MAAGVTAPSALPVIRAGSFTSSELPKKAGELVHKVHGGSRRPATRQLGRYGTYGPLLPFEDGCGCCTDPSVRQQPATPKVPWVRPTNRGAPLVAIVRDPLDRMGYGALYGAQVPQFIGHRVERSQFRSTRPRARKNRVCTVRVAVLNASFARVADSYVLPMRTMVLS